MRKTLLATMVLAAAGSFATGPALAADKLSVGVGGYMQQWFGMADQGAGAEGKDGGVAQKSDTEFNVRGSLESDNGLKFSVKIEVEGNNTSGGYTQIDESQLTVSGSFGQVVLGAEDPAVSLMHYGNRDVGVTMNCGDVGHWIVGVSGCSTSGLGTSGWGTSDRNQISYYTPRMSGVQFGATYVPNSDQETRTLPVENNDKDAWAVGLNYKGDLGGSGVALSFGHYQKNQVGGALTTATEDATSGRLATLEMLQAVEPDSRRESEIAALKMDLAPSKARGTKADAMTFTNFGLQVDVGAFGLDVAYATVDGGTYMAMDDGAGNVSIVKNKSKDLDVASAGVKYSDGPMAMSLSHMMVDYDDGGEANATMLSLSYALAPGIASKTSIFSAEQTKGNGTTSGEGTAFVTGFTLSF